MSNFEQTLLAAGKLHWLRWRVKLAAGKALRHVGRLLFDAGWRWVDGAAIEADRIVSGRRGS